MKLLYAVFALVCAVAPVHAATIYAVRPLDGYACMRLNVTEAEMLDRHGSGVFILTAPKANAPRGTMASSVVFARQPLQVINGYAAVLQINGQPGWIEADKIRPFNGMERCLPSVMSNGRLGIG